MLKIRLWALLGALLLAASFGVFSTVAWLTADPPVIDFSAARPYAQGHALAITESWINGRTTTLPVADGIDPKFNESASGGAHRTVKSISAFDWRRESVNGRLVETQYVLVDAVESDFVVVLPFVFDGPTPVLAAYPSIQPTRLVGPPPALEYQDVAALLDQIPAPVRERLDQWGAAYATSDGSTLRDLADDTAATAEMYRGLGGFTLVASPEIRSAVQVSQGVIVVRARFIFLPQNAPAGITSDFDLLVTASDTTKPRIVAWGAPGSGPALQPYQNRSR
jgi:hypothetical protein